MSTITHSVLVSSLRSKKTIDPMYQFWEELSAEDLEDLKKPIKKVIFFRDPNTVKLSAAFIAEYFFK